MAGTQIKIKQSAVEGKVPVAGSLQQGELALNTFDQKLYSKDSAGYVFEIGGASGAAMLTGATFTGPITAPDFVGPLNGAIQFTAKNTSGGTLTVGQVVYISGISGNTPTVGLADADDAAKMPAYGLVTNEAVDNDPVEITTFGPLTDVKTDYAGWQVGDTLYVSTTPGTLTNVPPTGEGTLIQNLGRIRRVQQSAGSITVGGAGRTNATPNLNDGNVFIGNASNQAAARALQIADTTGLQAALDGKVDDSQVLTNVPSGAVFTDTVYTHPTGAGNLHVPTGGTVGQVLTNTASGTGTWQDSAGGGASAINDLTDGYNDGSSVGLGTNALSAGSFNTAIGTNSLAVNTGAFNTATGYNSLKLNTTGTNNIATGYNSLINNTTGSQNSSYGKESLAQNTTGYHNVSVGHQSMLFNTTGTVNTGIGTEALMGNATSKLTGHYNTGIGYRTGYNLTTGQYNVLNGYQAGYSLTSGTDNVFIGSSAGKGQNGISNIAIGENSMLCAAGGSQHYNIALGRLTGAALTTGANNTILGQKAGQALTSGYNNVLIGENAGNDLTTHFNNVLIGNDAGATLLDSNKLHIANNQTESLIEGDFAAKTLRVNGTFSSTGKTYTTKTAAYTAIAGDLIMADTATTAAFTITLPTSPTSGDVIKIHDVKGNFATANLTVARGVTSQEPINGIAEDFVCDVDYQNVELLFTNATDGWRIL